MNHQATKDTKPEVGRVVAVCKDPQCEWNDAIAVVRKSPIQNPQSSIPNPVPLHTELPDSDLVVLVLTTDPEYPVWPCFHDGDTWRTCDASTLTGSIHGWLHLEEAAKILNPQNNHKATKNTKP